jgi:hypothetical protein
MTRGIERLTTTRQSTAEMLSELRREFVPRVESLSQPLNYIPR